MRTILPLLALLSAGPALATQCARVVDGFCGDQHARFTIDPNGTEAVFKVLIGAGETIHVRLPAAAKDVVMGNAALVEPRYDANVPKTILLSSQVGRGGLAGVLGAQTTLQFTLQGLPVLITLRVAPAAQSVTRVTLLHPDLEAEAQAERDIRKEVEAEMRAELAEGRESLVLRELGQSLLERAVVADSSERDFDRDLIGRTRQILAIGPYVGVVFEVVNRRRNRFELDQVVVSAEGAKPAGAIVGAVVSFDQPDPVVLRFEEQARGVIIFRPPPKGAPSYRLDITELGGAKRSLAITDISF